MNPILLLWADLFHLEDKTFRKGHWYPIPTNELEMASQLELDWSLRESTLFFFSPRPPNQTYFLAKLSLAVQSPTLRVTYLCGVHEMKTKANWHLRILDSFGSEQKGTGEVRSGALILEAELQLQQIILLNAREGGSDLVIPGM